jgi:Protein of unknown function (DUF2914)/Tetratricopeptide repeat
VSASAVDRGTVELERSAASRMNPAFLHMWEAREHGPVLAAAEKAAEAGNYISAEKLLREAARLQEASLGPRHPDLANTLNNLGIVCEITGKPDDAEQYFRRSVSIARTSLAADHPFVATSQKNLRDFCEARGKAVEPPAPEPEVEPAPVVQPPAPEATATVDPEPAPAADPASPEPAFAADPASPEPAFATDSVSPETAPATEPAKQSALDPDLEDPEVTSKKFFYRVALGALGPIAMLMVVLAAGLPRLGAPELAVPSREAAIDPPRTITPPPITPPPEPSPVDARPALEEPTTTAATKSSRAADEAITSDITAEPARPRLVRASLCGELDDFSCDPADRPVPTGPLFFYTQVKSPTATTIQHRWYQDNHLRQAVELRVEANRTAGYRTYSRNLMKSESAGDWRVEVRSQDGALLHEERFTVR